MLFPSVVKGLMVHRGQNPMRDAIISDRTMCPIITGRRLGILMSHACVDWTFLPSGKLIVSGDIATRLLSTSVFSMMKMEAVCMSAMAWLAVIVRAFEYCGRGYQI